MRIRSTSPRRLCWLSPLILFIAAMIFVSACSSVAAFAVSPRTTTHISTSNRRSFGANNCRELYGSSFFKQLPGESDIVFFKRIQAAASDPVAFEKMALGKDDEDVSTSTKHSSNSANGTTDSTVATTTSTYQRAEDWDAEVKSKQKRGEFTQEERLQFESQRYGNQFNQNEILRKNLNAF